ncbi:MAG TPA: hypothetical protein VMB50_11940 [Myxococcales bacterium]|nr:hypothetical protein [Myxococcales bacterium]
MAHVAGPGKLYTPGQVAVAAFFGLPLAGGLALASSLRRLDRRAEAARVLWLSGGATVLLIVLGILLPSDVHASFGDVLGVWWLHRWAKGSIGPAVEAHKAAGGRVRSTWSALGLGVASLAVFFGAAGGLAVAGPVGLREKLRDCAIDGDHEVCFDDGAGIEDARAVLKTLVAAGLDPGDEMDVKVRRKAGGMAVAFVVQDGKWKDAKVIAAFGEIGKELRRQVFPSGALEILLTDDGGATQQALPIE